MSTIEEQIVGDEFDVFISYAHADTEEASDRSPAQTLAEMLEAEGYSVWWDRELIGGHDWLQTLSEKVHFARKVIAVFSPNWITSAYCKAEMFAAMRVPQKFVPLLIKDFARPAELAHVQYIDAIGGNASMAKMKILAALGAPQHKPAEQQQPSTPADPSRVQLTLPSGTSRLFGRDVELSILADAWSGATKPKPNVVVFHAIGGAGKSALVRKFVDDLAAGDYRGAAKVYGWSAYSQGSGDNRDTVSAEGFIAEALKFFGHDLAEKPITDATERGRTLARLVRQQRTLMILDGLEPLQDTPFVNEGRLKDRGLAALITMLADDNPGLLVITSRQELPELASRKRVVNHSLNQLDRRAGAELLKHLGVHGRETELMRAVDEIGGHALTVNILGTYLANVCGGDVTRRDTLRLTEILEDMSEQDETKRKARHAVAVMRAYEASFAALGQTSRGKGVVEMMLMRIVGLFNRPAEPGAIAAILAGPANPGLTDGWHAMSARAQQANLGNALPRLRKLRLLLGPAQFKPAPNTNVVQVPTLIAENLEGGLDAHPVVRQHFGDQMKAGDADAFREANLRLYRYYVALPKKEQPDTLEEMEPLFHAIAHGCAAGLVQESFDDVYWRRVVRGNLKYIWRELGAFSSDLGAIASFFQVPWRTPTDKVSLRVQSFVLGQAAFCLQALGRMGDAVAPLEASASRDENAQDWRNAAITYSNLSELLLFLGRIEESIEVGRKAVTYANRSQNHFEMYTKRLRLADALHQKGASREAAKYFAEAEKMLAEKSQQLHGFAAFQLFSLLLDGKQFPEVIRRVSRIRESYKRDGHSALLDNALMLLSLAEAISGSVLDGPKALPVSSRMSEAQTLFDAAMEELRTAGNSDEIPRGLLARAAFRIDAHRWGAPEGDLAGAQQDLTEVHEIASRAGMRLFLTDYWLTWCKLVLAHDPKLENDQNRQNAELCWGQARDLIEATGYHRRDKELAELRAAIDGTGTA